MQFKYVGEDKREYLYPQAFTVEPGDVVEAEENPDEARFKPVATKKTKE